MSWQPLPTAPRVRVWVRVRVAWSAVEVRGRSRGMPWKGLPQAVPRKFHGMPRKGIILYMPQLERLACVCGLYGACGTPMTQELSRRRLKGWLKRWGLSYVSLKQQTSRYRKRRQRHHASTNTRPGNPRPIARRQSFRPEV